MRERLDPRPPIRWATHSMHLLMVFSTTVGGTLFGLAFVLWPNGVVDRVIGSLILAGVAACVAWALYYVARPVE